MPDQILAEVDKEERTFQRELIHGISPGTYASALDLERAQAFVREYDEKGDRQSRELRRQWCGAEAVERWDELAELRKEIHRVGEVAEHAIQVLRRRGYMSDTDSPRPEESTVTVVPTAEAAHHLRTMLERFRAGRREPLVFGDEGTPEAVVVEFADYMRLRALEQDGDIDEQRIQAELQRRLSSGQMLGVDSVEDFARSLGDAGAGRWSRWILASTRRRPPGSWSPMSWPRSRSGNAG